jgi:hypothetical protein
MSKRTPFLFIMLLLIIIFVFQSKRNHLTKQAAYNNPQHFVQLNGLTKVIALVFYGRRRHVEILSKYLIANLKKNGGLLDQVKFAVRTSNKKDLDYLDSLIELNSAEFKRYDFEASESFNPLYRAIDENEYVFKIDDDIVFIKKGCFESMLNEYIKNEHVFLSANVINHPRLSDLHARIGAIKPLCKFNSKLACNQSENSFEIIQNCSFNRDTFQWWYKPECAILAHENFIKNFQTNNLNAYDFKYWDFHYDNYDRYSINFVLSMGKYLNKMNEKINENILDEVLVSSVLPSQMGKHTFALGNAIVSHYAYRSQRNHLDSKTDLLERYLNISKSYLK